MAGQTITELETVQPQEVKEKKQYEWNYRWDNIIMHFVMHLAGFYGIYLGVVSAKWITLVYSFSLLVCGLLGITAGSHRLWAHRTYKAKTRLKVLLVIFQTLALQHNIAYWVKCHRVHHKFVDTDGDPHNSRRGLFFSHMGWMFIHPTPEVVQRYKELDFSDLYNDKLVVLQEKYYFTFFVPVIGILIPSAIPWYFWGESFVNAFFISSMLRYMLCINFIFSVNSVAHTFGSKPYDKNIYPSDVPWVSVVSSGEGWHNYHHVFPWDYKAGEFGKYRSNLAAGFLDLMAAIGWAYDLKSVSKEMIMKRMNRTGDGSRKIERLFSGDIGGTEHGDSPIWGYGDKDMTEEDMAYIEIHKPKKA